MYTRDDCVLLRVMAMLLALRGLSFESIVRERRQGLLFGDGTRMETKKCNNHDAGRALRAQIVKDFTSTNQVLP